MKEELNSLQRMAQQDTKDFSEKLINKINKLEQGDVFTVALDMDGCMLNGVVGDYRVSEERFVDPNNPICEERFKALCAIKELVKAKGAKFHLDICSPSALERLHEPTRKKIFAKLCELNGGPIVQFTCGSKMLGAAIYDKDGFSDAIPFNISDTDLDPYLNHCRININKRGIVELNALIMSQMVKNGDMSADNYANQVRKMVELETLPLRPEETMYNKILGNTLFVDNDPRNCNEVRESGVLTWNSFSTMVDKSKKTIPYELLHDHYLHWVGEIIDMSDADISERPGMGLEECREGAKVMLLGEKRGFAESLFVENIIDWFLVNHGVDGNKSRQIFSPSILVSDTELVKLIYKELKESKEAA